MVTTSARSTGPGTRRHTAPVPVTVRPAEVGDADGIAAVHVASWQWAYAGLMPAEVLDQHGCSSARLRVLTSNARARAFYEGQGWTVDGETKRDTMREGNEVHETRYGRRLGPQT